MNERRRVPGPLIETKFAAPRLPRGLVPRRFAQDRLDRAADARLILVSAPAGFGKTTLLGDWLTSPAEADRRIAWLSLDARDRDPVSFLTYLVAALRTVLPDVGAEAIELLATTPARTELALTAVLNDLTSEPHEVWLVLDDFHLADGPGIDDAVGFLAEHLPRQAHLVLSTRADPGFPLSRWRARGELVEIRAADLRFSQEETAAYFTEAGLDLAPEDVAALTDRTEGWVAALQLAALSLRGRADVRDFITRFAGDDRYVVDYLVEEVLAHQSGTVRDVLLRTSILARLSGPLCDAVLERDDSGAVLAALERSNLFLVPLDDRREWYRYHHLFADVLRARLLSEQPDESSRLHSRASRWFEQHGPIDEAVAHALAGSDFERAARLMELAAPQIRRDRQDAVMLDWLRALPDDVVRRNPVLGVFAGYGRMVAGDLAGAESRFEEADRALRSAADGRVAEWADTEELRTLPATIAVYRASLAQARGDVDGTVEHAEQALRLAGPDDHQARAGGAGFLGLAAWARGDVVRALQAFSEAVASLHAGGNLIDELTSTVVLADLWVAAGRPGRARRLYEGALRVAEEQGGAVARAAAELHVGLGELDVEAGDLAAAQRHLDAAAEAGRPAGMPESRYRWFVAEAALARAHGDPTEAIRLLDQAEPLYHPGFFPDVRPIAAMRARVRIAEGDLASAADWAHERGLSPDDEAAYLREFDHLTLARLLLGSDAAEEALGLLDRLQAAAESAGRGGGLLEIGVLQALAFQARGQEADAALVLTHALDSAPEPEASVRLFLNEGAPMARLLSSAARDHPENPRLRRLVRLAADPDVAGRPTQPAASLLSERELEVLRLLDSELTGPEIARRLFVSHNTLRSHTKHIFTKLEVTSRRAAVLRGRERGLL